MKTITIYGPGCARCDLVERVIRRVIDELGVDAVVEKVSDFAALALAGITMTPSVAVDGVIVLSGRIPRDEDVEDWLCG